MATVEKLQSELSRVKAEEECKRVDYNHSREDLQETWDKLVSLRTHISYFNLVIEDTKVECIAAETNHPVYGDLEAITDGSINYSLHSASRVAAIQALKERIRVKEGLKARVVMLEQKLVESRKQLHVFSEALKNNSNVNFNSTSISSSLAAVGNVPQSLELRQIILQTSHHLEGNEKEYIRAKAELEMVELELSKALNSEENEEIFRMQAQSQSRGRFAQRNGVDKPITLSYADINRIGDIAYGRDISHTSDILPSLGLDSAQSALLGVSSPYTSTPGPRTQLKVTANYSTDKSMVDLISVGLPLSTDLIHAIRTGEIYNNTLEYLVNRHQIRCELTLYEALSGQARIRRMNGEPPKLFLDRLLRRRDSLLVLDTQLQAEVVERIETVKKMREIVRMLHVLVFICNY